MENSYIDRQTVLSKLKEGLMPFDYVLSLYEGGGATSNRIDEWSDIDLGIMFTPGFKDKAIETVESVLSDISPLDLAYTVPNPPTDVQKFYRLENCSPFLLIDLCYTENQEDFSEDDLTVNFDHHGEFICHFDKTDKQFIYINTDIPKLKQYLGEKLKNLPVAFQLFQTLPLKELHRKNYVEAMDFYHKATLKPLIELLRIQYKPLQADFHTRYIYYAFPDDVLRKLESLYFVPQPEDLWQKQKEAEEWFFELLSQIDLERLG